MSANTRKYLIAFLILLMLVLVYSFFIWYRTMHAPMLTQGKATAIKVHRGSTIRDLATDLAQRGLLSHPAIFVFDARVGGDARHLRFGEYKIAPGMTAAQLLSNITQGVGLVKHRVTFVEGWTFQDMKQALMQDDNIRHLLKDKSDHEIMRLLGHADEHPEGRFFPDTYVFNWQNSDVEILQHAYDRMKIFLSEAWKARASDLPYQDAYQALIVASLIEKETSLSEERPIVAGVILRRLKKSMRLQVDPTVLYGLKKSFSETITKRDLMTRTAYNTYLIHGLPPTPIDMPSGASITAALHPADTQYLYYVSRGDGSHEFSKTYHQHLKAVSRYRKLQEMRAREKSHE